MVASEDVMRLKSRIFAFSSFSRDAIERSSRSSLLDPTSKAETRAKGGRSFLPSEVLGGSRFGSFGDGENAAATEIEAARIRDIFGTGGFVLDRLVLPRDGDALGRPRDGRTADVERLRIVERRSSNVERLERRCASRGRRRPSGLATSARLPGAAERAHVVVTIVVVVVVDAQSSRPEFLRLGEERRPRGSLPFLRLDDGASAAALVSLDFSSCARICAGVSATTSCKPAADASLCSAARHHSSSLSVSSPPPAPTRWLFWLRRNPPHSSRVPVPAFAPGYAPWSSPP